MAVELEWLVRTVLFLVFCLVLLLLYLCTRKAFENVKRRRISEMMESYRQPVFGYLLSGRETRMVHPNGGTWKEQALEELLLQCAGLFRGDETVERIRYYAERYLTGRYRKHLMSRKWSTRVNALYRIDRFDLKKMKPDLMEMFVRRRTTTAEKMLSLKLLARWGVPGTVERMKQGNDAFPDFAGRLILSGMPQALFRGMMDRWPELPDAWRYTAVDVIGVSRRTEFREELDMLLDSDDPEMRIRSLKALSQIDILAPQEKYLPHSLSGIWQERMMAAKLYGSIRSGMFAGSLVRLLSDPVWFVRSQAAQSLLAYADGTEVLREIAAASDDRFAREMAAEWLERGENADHVG